MAEPRRRSVGVVVKTSQNSTKSIENRKMEFGLYWTYELNEQFIRTRKESEKKFAGKRSGSFPYRGWVYVLKEMGISDKCTPAQAKKRWETFVAKYKDEKDPMRVNKAPDTPITWPLYPLMDWALADKIALKEKSQVYDYQITEEGDVIVNTEINNDDASVINDESTILDQNVSFVIVEEPLVVGQEEVVNMELPEVTETVEERGALQDKRSLKRIAVSTGGRSRSVVHSKRRRCKLEVLTDAEFSDREELTSMPASPGPSTEPIQPIILDVFTTASRPVSPPPVAPTPVVPLPVEPAAHVSVHQRIAAMLDAEESEHTRQLHAIRDRLDVLVRLQREQNESLKLQAEASQQQAVAIEKLACTSARQATALEHCVQLVETRFLSRQQRVEIDLASIN